MPSCTWEQQRRHCRSQGPLTLLTQGQVVSTIWTCRSFSSRISCGKESEWGRRAEVGVSPLTLLGCKSFYASIIGSSIDVDRQAARLGKPWGHNAAGWARAQLQTLSQPLTPTLMLA